MLPGLMLMLVGAALILWAFGGYDKLFATVSSTPTI